MITPELANYVRQQLALGIPSQTIATNLLAQGWSQQDVSDVIHIAAAGASAAPMPPPAPASEAPQIAAATASAMSGKPKKSTLWLWTTLWLTATIDGFGIGIVLILLGVLAGGFPNIVNLLIGVVALACGSYLAPRYVLKRSVVERARAHRLALYAVCIPTLMPLVVAIFVTRTLPAALALIGLTLVNSSVMYGVIRWYLESHGD